MGISIWHILIVVLVVFLLFGAGRVPRMMEDLAKGIKSFKKGLNDDDPTPPKPTEPKRLEDRSVEERAAAERQRDEQR